MASQVSIAGCSFGVVPGISASGPFLGEQLVRADAVGVIVGDGRDDQLVGFGGVAETFQLVRDLARRAGELGVDAVGDQLAVSLAPHVAAGLPGGGQLDGAFSGADTAHPQAVTGGQLAGHGLGAWPVTSMTTSRTDRFAASARVRHPAASATGSLANCRTLARPEELQQAALGVASQLGPVADGEQPLGDRKSV